MVTSMLDQYEQVVGPGEIFQLRQLAGALKGARVVHVNSTREGGGVAEILHRLVPLQRELGLDATWEVITGNSDFYECTKGFHNALQGNRTDIPASLLRIFEETNRSNAEVLRDVLTGADYVFIHDPQPAPLLRYCQDRRGKWIWRCHIDASRPYRPVWKYLREFVEGYDASIWSLAAFAQSLPHPTYLIAPSIDPLSEKNIEIDPSEIEMVCAHYGLDPDRPLIVQISRFDRFKDPLGVIEGYRMVKTHTPLQLVLAGGEQRTIRKERRSLKRSRPPRKTIPTYTCCFCPPTLTARSTLCSGRRRSFCRSLSGKDSASQLPRPCGRANR